MSGLDNHYAVQRLSSDFSNDIEKLQRKQELSSEPAIRQEYEETIHSLQHRQEQLQSLAVLLDRFEAQLTGTMNAVDSIVTGVVSLKGRSAQQAAEKIDPLLNIIQTERDELRHFDEQSQKYSIA
jgi:transcriptional regulator of heat shock response